MLTGEKLRQQDAELIAAMPRRLRQALDRQDEARRCARFGGWTYDDRMRAIYRRDAELHNEARARAEALFAAPLTQAA